MTLYLLAFQYIRRVWFFLLLFSGFQFFALEEKDKEQHQHLFENGDMIVFSLILSAILLIILN